VRIDFLDKTIDFQALPILILSFPSSRVTPSYVHKATDFLFIRSLLERRLMFPSYRKNLRRYARNKFAVSFRNPTTNRFAFISLTT
jgi:hypothetical protein